MLSVRGGAQWKFKPKLRPSRRVARDSPAKRLNSFAHSAKAIALSLNPAAPVVLNFKHAISIIRRDSQYTVSRLRMAYNIGDSFAHDQRSHTLLRGRHLDFGSFRFHTHAGALQHRLCSLQLLTQLVSTVTPQRVADLCHGFPRNSLNVRDLALSHLRISIKEFSCQG